VDTQNSVCTSKVHSSPKGITSGIGVMILSIEYSARIYIFKNRLVFLSTSLLYFQNAWLIYL